MSNKQLQYQYNTKYLKLIIAHLITTVLIVNLTSKRMNNSCDKIVHCMTIAP